MAQLGRTLADMVVRIRRYIKQPDADISHWSDDFIKQAFNSIYRLRCSELHLADEGHFQHESFRDLEANKARYEFPPGFTRMEKLELVRTDGRTVPLTRYSRRYEPNDTGDSADDAYMPTFRLMSGGFKLEPKPTSTVVDGIHMEYNGVPTELEDDSDSLHADFPEMFDELLVIDTVIALLHSEELQEHGLQRTFMTWEKEWEVRWERYISNRASFLQRIVPFITSYRDG
jgi:hypothetical protein